MKTATTYDAPNHAKTALTEPSKAVSRPVQQVSRHTGYFPSALLAGAKPMLLVFFIVAQLFSGAGLANSDGRFWCGPEAKSLEAQTALYSLLKANGDKIPVDPADCAACCVLGACCAKLLAAFFAVFLFVARSSTTFRLRPAFLTLPAGFVGAAFGARAPPFKF